MYKVKNNSPPGKQRMASLNRLTGYDEAHSLTSQAHALVREKGYSVETPARDCGRTLPYYAPIDAILREHYGSFEGLRILHLAASTGIYTKYLQEEGAMAMALDVNRDAIEIAEKIGNRDVILGDAFKLNLSVHFKGRPVDAFISDNFLFTGYNPFQVDFALLLNMHEILKPGGRGIIFNPRARMLYFSEQIENIGFKFTVHGDEIECPTDIKEMEINGITLEKTRIP